MSAKTQVMLGMMAGSILGGYVPVMFGVSAFSFTSIIFSAVGGIAGIYIAYKLSNH